MEQKTFKIGDVVSHIWADPATRMLILSVDGKSEVAVIQIQIVGPGEVKTRREGERLNVSLEYLKAISDNPHVNYETSITSKYRF